MSDYINTDALGQIDSKLAAQERDAARYRWLRFINPSSLAVWQMDDQGKPQPHSILLGSHLDKAIDKEMAAPAPALPAEGQPK